MTSVAIRQLYTSGIQLFQTALAKLVQAECPDNTVMTAATADKAMSVGLKLFEEVCVAQVGCLAC